VLYPFIEKKLGQEGEHFSEVGLGTAWGSQPHLPASWWVGGTCLPACPTCQCTAAERGGKLGRGGMLCALHQPQNWCAVQDCTGAHPWRW